MSFDLPDFFEKEWPVIFGAPLNFTVAVIFSNVVVFYFLRFWYARQIANLKTHNGTLKARLGQVKDQIDPLNNDNKRLKDELTTLQAQLRAKASPEQIANTNSNVNNIVVNIGRNIDKLTEILTVEPGHFNMAGKQVTLSHKSDGTEESR